MNIICPICTRDTPDGSQEKHHLVPRCKKGKETVLVCVDCGNQIHKLFTEKELEKVYNTVAAILTNEDVQKWAKWVKNKKPNDFGICMATKKRKY